MDQFPVSLETDGHWSIGKPPAWHIEPAEGQTRADAFAQALDALHITRAELFFESEEQREKFDEEFGPQ